MAKVQSLPAFDSNIANNKMLPDGDFAHRKLWNVPHVVSAAVSIDVETVSCRAVWRSRVKQMCTHDYSWIRALGGCSEFGSVVGVSLHCARGGSPTAARIADISCSRSAMMSRAKR